MMFFVSVLLREPELEMLSNEGSEKAIIFLAISIIFESDIFSPTYQLAYQTVMQYLTENR